MSLRLLRALKLLRALTLLSAILLFIYLLIGICIVIIFSSIVSFYGPLTVMLFTYFRIYKAAVAHTKSLRLGAKQLSSNGAEGSQGGQEVVLRMHRGGAASSTNSNKCRFVRVNPYFQ